MTGATRTAGCFAFVGLIGSLAVQAAADSEGNKFFETHIRPILAEHCYECHSEKSSKVRGGLYLDRRAGWEQGGEQGPEIVPGRPDESRLIRAVRYNDPTLQMPPKQPLSAKQVRLLEEWVARGAPDPRDTAVPSGKHDSRLTAEQARARWPYTRLAPGAIPVVNDKDRVRDLIDAFLLAELEKKGLALAAEVDRRVLIRRAAFDLTGLPPTPQEIEAFVSDSDPQAYEKLVDRLLTSPAYGERWARHWLDVARFAESHGFEQDYDRPHAYHYRDFVIRAFNEDLPYDTFVKWQIAGDEYAPGNPQALAATGFLGAGVFPTQLTEAEFESARYDELDDMVSTMGTAMLGLTFGCARCHDHKYDPISAQEYYRLAATFATTIRSNVEVDLNPAATQAALQEWERGHAPRKAALDRYEREVLLANFQKWESQGGRVEAPPAPKAGAWRVLGPFRAANFDKAFETDFGPEKGVKLDQVHGREKLKWREEPDWSDGVVHSTLQGDNAATYLFREIHADRGMELPLSLGSDDAIRLWHNGREVLSNKVTRGAAPDQEKVVLNLTAGRNEVLLKIVNAGGGYGFYYRADILTVPEDVQKAWGVAAASRTPEQVQHLLQWYRRLDEGWLAARRAVEEHEQKKPKPQLTQMMICSEGVKPIPHHADGRGFPHFYPQVHYVRRGDPRQKQGVAEQGFPAALTRPGRNEADWKTLPPAGSPLSYRRRALAEWITDPRDGAGHLLARVMANRLWQHHFGRGLVATSNDFGLQGSGATHAELLDHLASALIEGDWRLKPLHRRLMLSSAYRLGRKKAGEGPARDPDNLLFGRREPRRLEAEAIRDALLTSCGTLDRTPFGPGTLDENHRRRSIYFMIKRSKLIPALMLFDAPEPLGSLGRRDVTTVAPQALMFLNGDFVRRNSESLARDVWAGSEDGAAVERAFQRVLGRGPGASEKSLGLEFLATQKAGYVAEGLAEPAATSAARTDFCQALFGLNEFVYVE